MRVSVACRVLRNNTRRRRMFSKWAAVENYASVPNKCRTILSHRKGPLEHKCYNWFPARATRGHYAPNQPMTFWLGKPRSTMCVNCILNVCNSNRRISRTFKCRRVDMISPTIPGFIKATSHIKSIGHPMDQHTRLSSLIDTHATDLEVISLLVHWPDWPSVVWCGGHSLCFHWCGVSGKANRLQENDGALSLWMCNLISLLKILLSLQRTDFPSMFRVVMSEISCCT